MPVMMHIWLQLADNSGRLIKGYTYKDGKFGLILTSHPDQGLRLDTATGSMATNTVKIIDQLLAQRGDNDPLPDAELAAARKIIQTNTKLAIKLTR